jgi:hypothetical protein
MAASSLTAAPLPVLLESESFRLPFLSVDGVTSGGSAKFQLDPRLPSVSWMLLVLKEKKFWLWRSAVACLPIVCKKAFFLLIENVRIN